MSSLDMREGGALRRGRLKPPRTDSRTIARLVKGVVGGILLASLALAGGFLAFLIQSGRDAPPPSDRADAIVVLTGGADRISDAVDWLKAGKGRRLLISGVARDVSRAELGRAAPDLAPWLDCCVDLGHAAQNTAGNAKEARFWAERHGYRSLLVVTSAYHMPRAMVEFRRQMPEATLISAPVVTDRFRALNPFADAAALRLLGSEYAKFLVAYARAGLTAGRTMHDTEATSPNRRPV